MKATDIEIEKLTLTKPEDLVKCINLLCGQESKEADLYLVEEWIKKANTIKLNNEQFNELLLVLNHITISEGFFTFFFKVKLDKGDSSLEVIKSGTIDCRLYAMLCYGNFRYAYKNWREMSFEDIQKDTIKRCCLLDGKVFSNRDHNPKILDVSRISKEDSPYLGYISAKETTKDIKITQAIFYKTDKTSYDWTRYDAKYLEEIQKIADDLNNEQITKWSPSASEIMQILNTQQNLVEKVQKIGRMNLDIYLTWDIVDIYIATSMREKWEYEEAFDFVQSVLYNPELDKHNLRFFDPTQSWVENPIEKGLVEGLMLKRAKFTIYLVQETDTLGKDSELAITLAQGKPVIAFIPQINIQEHLKKIQNYPLKYFRKRISFLEADDIFLECRERIEKTLGKGKYSSIKEFSDLLERYFSEKTFVTNKDEENEFKKNNHDIFWEMCTALSIAENEYFNKRANTLQKTHPLGVQISLHTGVANGVLVARHEKQCIELINRIVKNQMEFTINIHKDGYNLDESITNSHFRIITNNEKITNSFWNFYLE
jgi:hypothetical protein